MQDGNIHCHVANLSRKGENGKVRSAVATAAYISGERLWNEALQKHSSFSMREDVVFSQIAIPDGAPKWAKDRTKLWNTIELCAKRKDARLAKTIEAAITRELPKPMWEDLLRDFVAPFVEAGVVVDMAIHEDGTSNNPHVHIMLTTQELLADGFGKKLVGLEKRQFVKNVRASWADVTNKYLEKAGSTLRVDHRSYKTRGIDREPGKHRGPNRTEREGKRTLARRVRQEQTKEQVMKVPTLEEKEQYPALTKRDDWPPNREPAADLNPDQRDEHHRYWQDKQAEQAAEQTHTPPEYEPDQSEPWYEQARDKARQEAGIVDEEIEEQEPNPQSTQDKLVYEREDKDPDIERHKTYEGELRVRARDLWRTPDEEELMQLADRAAPETRKYIIERIMQARVDRLREEDTAKHWQKIEKSMEPSLRDKVKKVFAHDPEWEEIEQEEERER